MQQKQHAFADPWHIEDHGFDCSGYMWLWEFLYFQIAEAFKEVILSRHSIHTQVYGLGCSLGQWCSWHPSSIRVFEITF